MIADRIQKGGLTIDNPDDKHKPPGVAGEESVSGDSPDVESDDDVDKMVKDVGLYEESDGDTHPEVDIAGQVARDEKVHREK